MGIKNMISKVGEKAGDKVAKLAVLSPEQLEEVQVKREKYLSQMPDPTDTTAEELTMRLLAAGSVEIHNAYLPQLDQLYTPVKKDFEYGSSDKQEHQRLFRPEYNIRYFNITKWVTNKNENSLEKLVNVYEVLSNERCNIALIFHRTCEAAEVYLAVTNIENADNSVDVNNYKERLADAVRGNFPGSEWGKEGSGVIPCFNSKTAYSVASASNIPTEKSEKFISQTIEKLLDGCIPDKHDKEYILILLATPIQDIEERKLRLAELYSGLAPYASWTTDFHYTEADSINSSATVGVNVGASAGIQNGQNQAVTKSDGKTDSLNESQTDSLGTTQTDSQGETKSDSKTHTESENSSNSEGVNANISATASFAPNGMGGSITAGEGVNTSTTKGKSFADATTKGVTKSVTESVAQTTGKAIANTLGRAVTKSVAKTVGVFSSTNLGANFGVNFARSSSVAATIGKNEGITQTYTNYTIKHALEVLEEQMKRFEESTALGMWDFAAYVLSEDINVANNVAHSYIALTQGEKSYMSKAAINLWRGDIAEHSQEAKEIYGYIRELRHPVFGLNPNITDVDPKFNVYPSVVTATTSLSGKELAYSLNFPQKSVAGLPVIECAEFGRNIVTYDPQGQKDKEIRLGQIFHMHHEEKVPVMLSKQSLASHTFISGSTGSGKSNTVYQILNEALDNNIKFLVIEPAKGEYKHVFGMENNVAVYGTNPEISPLLRIDPFSFPEGIHVLEHLDRLIEIFNVCWPMYAAMPAVLKSAVERSYSDCGWNLNTSDNKYGERLCPSFADIARNVKVIIDSSEYDAENKGAYKGSLLTRLESLTNGINGMIFTQDEIGEADMFDKNVIVDLSRVGSSETKSLIMGMLVLKLQEYRMIAVDGMNVPLKHITVLEEAHNLLRRTSVGQSSEGTSLSGKSVEMLANAIAEMRTYGEGFIIADQAPELLDTSVTRNTNTKIIMRLPDQGDRELVGRAANLDDDQIAELAKLPCGVAAVYQNEWVQPVLCKVDRYNGAESCYQLKREDKNVFIKNEEVANSLLQRIMDRELFQKGDREDLRELKSLLIKSNLSTQVKVDFLDYMEVGWDKKRESLGRLVYDFLEVEDAIKLSQKCEDIYGWIDSVTENLSLSLKSYSKKQIDLIMALILQELTVRDVSYKGIFHRFTEVYKKGGGVFQ